MIDGKKHAVIYARTSPSGEDKGLAADRIERQVSCCVSYCKKHDLEVVEIFQDCKVSGAKRDRENLISAMDVATEVGGVLVVREVSRFARCSVYAQESLDWLYYNGAIIRTADGKLDDGGEIAAEMEKKMNELSQKFFPNLNYGKTLEAMHEIVHGMLFASYGISTTEKPLLLSRWVVRANDGSITLDNDYLKEVIATKPAEMRRYYPVAE